MARGLKINDKDVDRLDKEGKLANYARRTIYIGKLGIERYYEDVLHGQTGYEEVEVGTTARRVIRQLKEVPPQAGRDIYLTLDLKLQQYIETLLAGSLRRRGGDRPAYRRYSGAGFLTPSYDPNLFVDGISSKRLPALLNDPNTPLVNRATQGVHPLASTVKPYVAVSALSAGVITRNTSLFDPGRWQWSAQRNAIVTGKVGPRLSERHQSARGVSRQIPISTRSPMTWASTVSQEDEQVWLGSLHRYRPLRGALWQHADLANGSLLL